MNVGVPLSVLARWGDAGTERQAWRPLARVELGFGSELGARIEAALAVAERHVQLLEMRGAIDRRIVDRIVAALPGGVRPPISAGNDPTTDDGDRDVRARRARPVHAPEAFVVPPSFVPWTAFTDRDLKPENIVESTPPAPVAVIVEPPPVTKPARKPRAPKPLTLDQRVDAALSAAGIKHGRLIPIGRGKYSLLVEEGAAE